MRIRKIAHLLRSVAACALLTLAGAAHAGGPLAVCNPGEPFLWPNGGANVPFNPDQGNLAILSNAQATAAVTDAFNAWGDVPTATISYVNAGALPVDVDITNFLPFLQATAPDGLSAIVYDDTGEIFAALFGPGSGVLGFAGPEWGDPATCTILEGLSFLNGPAVSTLEGLLNVMVHEFGHYSNLAHTVVNGQLFLNVGDTSGPGSDATFGAPPDPATNDIIETMYPFLFSSFDQTSRTLAPDDVAILSRLYPEPGFAGSVGSISGSILLGAVPVTGVNVIARNVADPFFDAVSAISSDFTQGAPSTGEYTITGLTPGAAYAVYIDEILDGGFSTPLASPLPGPEEFYNGANESGDPATDNVSEFVPVASVAGQPATGIDVLVNLPPPLSPLPTGDDGTVAIPLPFALCVAGQAYSTAFINGNGFLTLGAGPTGITFLESAAGFVTGPPRIAGFWDDLNPNAGGSVFYDQTADTFTVTWDSVPEFFVGGSNTVSVVLSDNSSACLPGNDDDSDSDDDSHGDPVRIVVGALTSTDGLTGVSAGAFATSGFEVEIDLNAPPSHDDDSDSDGDSDSDDDGSGALSLKRDAAVFEQFSGDVDIANSTLEFVRLGKAYRDRFERNDSLDKAAKINLPFDSIDTGRSFTAISPAAADIDFFRFKRRLSAGTTLVAEVLTGQIDSVLGVFRCDDGPGGSRSRRCDPSTATLVAFNDDSNGLLSSIVYSVTEDGSYALGVTFCCDFDFDGVDPGQGGPLDVGRYVLDAFVIDGTLIPLTDESTTEIPLGFDFPYQGEVYNSVYVNSNGYLTFGAGEIFQFIPNVPDFENGLPRVAPLWVDLNPGAGGLVYFSGDSGSTTITFQDVPEFFFGGSNNFSVTLDSGGGVTLSYTGMTAPEGITGLAEGGGAASNAVDLSTSPSWPAAGSTHEQFDFLFSPFDLDGTVLSFDP